MAESKIKRWMRALSGTALLVMLAVCGYVGSRTEAPQTVSVSVNRQPYEIEEIHEGTAEDATERLRLAREEEMAMLQFLIQSEAADDAARRDASSQMLQIADRMETEVQVAACLEEMGFAGCAVICGGQMIHLVLPHDYIEEEANKNRILDAVSGIAGCEAADIKLILTKK